MNVFVCICVDITYLLGYLLTFSIVSNLCAILFLTGLLFYNFVGYVFVLIYTLISLIQERYFNCILILPFISCLFLLCVIRFTSTSANIIIYWIYALFTSGFCICANCIDSPIVKIYLGYLITLTLIYVFVYGLLGVVRIAWSLLVIINLCVKLFIWVVAIFSNCDCLFSCEYALLQGIFSVIILLIGIDEFKNIYVVQSSFWVILILVSAIYYGILFCIYFILYIASAMLVLITTSSSLSLSDKIISFISASIWSGLPIILLSYFKLVYLVFIVLLYDSVIFISLTVSVLITLVVAAYLLINNWTANIFFASCIIAYFTLQIRKHNDNKASWKYINMHFKCI